METKPVTTRQKSSRITDEQMEQIIGNLLRAGVVLAAVVVLMGGIIFLSRHASAYPEYSVFRGVPASLRNIRGIVHLALNLRGQGIIQLGLLILIATPVARVLLSLLAFVLQRDRTYIIITLIVFLILIFSLFGGAHI